MLLALSRHIDEDPGVPHERKFNFPSRDGFTLLGRPVLADGNRRLHQPRSISHGMERRPVALITDPSHSGGPDIYVAPLLRTPHRGGDLQSSHTGSQKSLLVDGPDRKSTAHKYDLRSKQRKPPCDRAIDHYVGLYARIYAWNFRKPAKLVNKFILKV